MKRYGVIIAVVVLGMLTGLWMVNVRVAKAPTDGKACTEEAKLCPDGSAVGRTGPNCEFSECPSVGPATLEARIGQEVSSLGVRIVPLDVVEDSRCPIDVTCIQAGTVRIQARLISGLGEVMQEFKIGQPITTEAEEITLAEVSPAPKAGIKINSSDYLFTFRITKREVPTLPSGSGVRGTVSLGPTCPVERIPPDPACAEKPYATAIVVYRAGVTSPFIIGNSDASGVFELALPPGSYTLNAKGGTVLPRCNEVSVSVSTNAYVTADISCDTGIR